MQRKILGGPAQPVVITGPDPNGDLTTNPIEVTFSSAAVSVVEQQTYTSPKTGELAGSATAVQMPNVACKLVRFKASYDNAGRVYIGIAGVTVANGATDTTTGYQLSAGEETGWIPVDNLNRFYRICDNAGDDLTYLALV